MAYCVDNVCGCWSTSWGTNSSDDGLLLILKVLVELGTSPVVPYEVRVLCVAVQGLQ